MMGQVAGCWCDAAVVGCWFLVVGSNSKSKIGPGQASFAARNQEPATNN
jgi:hypothetical protein